MDAHSKASGNESMQLVSSSPGIRAVIVLLSLLVSRASTFLLSITCIRARIFTKLLHFKQPVTVICDFYKNSTELICNIIGHSCVLRTIHVPNNSDRFQLLYI